MTVVRILRVHFLQIFIIIPFERKYHLQQHLRIHDNNFDKCIFCPWQGMYNEGYGQIHLAMHFNMTGTHVCSFCGMKFFYASRKRTHEEVFHERIENRYNCKMCGFSTYSNSVLQKHVCNKKS